jgi:hypothetical protein
LRLASWKVSVLELELDEVLAADLSDVVDTVSEKADRAHDVSAAAIH